MYTSISVLEALHLGLWLWNQICCTQQPSLKLFVLVSLGIELFIAMYFYCMYAFHYSLATLLKCVSIYYRGISGGLWTSSVHDYSAFSQLLINFECCDYIVWTHTSSLKYTLRDMANVHACCLINLSKIWTLSILHSCMKKSCFQKCLQNDKNCF